MGQQENPEEEEEEGYLCAKEFLVTISGVRRRLVLQTVVEKLVETVLAGGGCGGARGAVGQRPLLAGIVGTGAGGPPGLVNLLS